jgi:hypothetical protein
MTTPDPEQFSTRLNPDVLFLLRLYATLESRPQRAIVEEALVTYFDSHDLSQEVNEVYGLIDRLKPDRES